MAEKRYKEVDVLDNVIYINGNIIGYQQLCDLLNKLEEENSQLRLELDTHKHPLWSTREAERIVNELKQENEQLKSENDSYKNMFFEIVETALTDTNCKELYCKGILDIFDKANSLNQAREMIKEHLK